MAMANYTTYKTPTMCLKYEPVKKFFTQHAKKLKCKLKNTINKLSFYG